MAEMKRASTNKRANLWHIEAQAGRFERLVRRLRREPWCKKKFISDLRSRFLPSGCLPQFGDAELWAILGYLADDVFLIERLPPYPWSKRASRLRVPRKSRSETQDHHDLKCLATLWLKQVHEVTGVEYEVPYAAGICDVMSSDCTWFIECGASRPSKVWSIFENPPAEHRRIVFFTFDGITVFKPGPRLPAFQETLRSYFEKEVKDFDRSRGGIGGA